MPLPHISASLPSALITRIDSGARFEVPISSTPSAPIPTWRSHQRSANSRALSMASVRASRTMKSLRAPWYLLTVLTERNRGSGRDRRDRVLVNQVRFALVLEEYGKWVKNLDGSA